MSVRKPGWKDQAAYQDRAILVLHLQSYIPVRLLVLINNAGDILIGQDSNTVICAGAAAAFLRRALFLFSLDPAMSGN
jgi:hypothetical protein